jgi:hypothetical protein
MALGLCLDGARTVFGWRSDCVAELLHTEKKSVSTRSVLDALLLVV